MRRHTKKFITFAVAVLFGVVALCSCGLADYDVKKGQEVVSPDGQKVATFYVISGGGAAGFVMARVKISPKSQAFKSDLADEDYVFEVRHENFVSMRWQDNYHLVISYDKSADVHRSLPTKSGTNISYVPTTATRKH